MPLRFLASVLVLCSALPAQSLRSLKNIVTPEPPGLGTYVKDRNALIALGKALFWDMQAGSDGRFPFRWFADPSNRASEILRDTSMRVGSAGIFRRAF